MELLCELCGEIFPVKNSIKTPVRNQSIDGPPDRFMGTCPECGADAWNIE